MTYVNNQEWQGGYTPDMISSIEKQSVPKVLYGSQEENPVISKGITLYN